MGAFGFEGALSCRVMKSAGCFLFASADYSVAVGDDEVDGYVVLLGVDAVDELEVVAYSDGYGAAAGEEAVVVSLSAAEAVSGPVVGNGELR